MKIFAWNQDKQAIIKYYSHLEDKIHLENYLQFDFPFTVYVYEKTIKRISL